MIEPKTEQISLFDLKGNTKTPAEEWPEDAAKHALDELFNATYAYRNSKEYMKLMRFVSRFRFYSPYNAMLIRLQRPGAGFVATPTRWKRDYDHYVKPNANPIVILQPMGPVMFVFDVSDTEPGPDARPIPTAYIAYIGDALYFYSLRSEYLMISRWHTKKSES